MVTGDTRRRLVDAAHSTHSTHSAHGTHSAHDAVLSGEPPHRHARDLVVESWMRSAAAGLDCERDLAPVTLEQREIGEYRAAHPLSNVFPLLYDVLGRAAEACDSVMAIADANGQLLWVCGDRGNLARAEQIHFVEGSVWNEASAGTNAPGTALLLDEPVQIRGAEHFSRAVQRWSCAAAPIHDPQTHAILGIVDVTGGPAVDSPQTMAMVRAAARMAEAELGRLHAVGLAGAAGLVVPTWSPGHVSMRVDALGRPDCQITDRGRVIRLSPRHSEILVILLGHPEGLTGDQLAVELSADEVNPSTLRAETTRLRSLLGPDVLHSRPYRLRVEGECDWLTVEGHLSAGRLPEALRAYSGPLLPQSDAPYVVGRRERLERMLRAALLASDNTDLMLAWTRSRWGADDLEMWQRQAGAFGPDSPLRAIATAEVARLNSELGAPRSRAH